MNSQVEKAVKVVVDGIKEFAKARVATGGMKDLSIMVSVFEDMKVEDGDAGVSTTDKWIVNIYVVTDRDRMHAKTMSFVYRENAVSFFEEIVNRLSLEEAERSFTIEQLLGDD